MKKRMYAISIHAPQIDEPSQLRQKLETWDATRLHKSLWVIVTDQSADQMRDHLLTVTSYDEAVAIIELNAVHVSTLNVDQAALDWMGAAAPLPGFFSKG